MRTQGVFRQILPHGPQLIAKEGSTKGQIWRNNDNSDIKQKGVSHARTRHDEWKIENEHWTSVRQKIKARKKPN